MGGFARFIVTCAVFTGVLVVALNGSRAAEKLIRIAGPDFPPYYVAAEDKRIEGQVAEILSRVIENAGYGWSGEIFPAARLMTGLIEGEVQATLVVRNKVLDEASTVIRSSKPVTEMVLNVYSLKEPVAIKSVEDFRGKTLIVLRGYGYGGLRTWLDRVENNVTLLEANNFESAIKMLSYGRAPLALMYDVNYQAGVKAVGAGSAAIVENAFQRTPLYIYLNKSVSADAQKTMDELMASYDQLVRQKVLQPPENLPQDVINAKRS